METTEFNTAAFVEAYTSANRIAQTQDPTSAEFQGAYQIADDLGHGRNSMEWQAAVGGAAAFYINNNRF